MEVALRRRLEGVVDIAISQSRQTTEVEFTQGPHAFSPRAFRDALGEAGVEVLRFEIEACGVIEQKDNQRWLAAGKNRFLLVEEGTASGPVGKAVCVSGRLNDHSAPHRLEIIALEFVTHRESRPCSIGSLIHPCSAPCQRTPVPRVPSGVAVIQRTRPQGPGTRAMSPASDRPCADRQ